jgi:mannose-6-phosphate isomerase-like protein (cupin superfamily)
VLDASSKKVILGILSPPDQVSCSKEGRAVCPIFCAHKVHWMHHTGSEVSSPPTLIEKPARVAAAGSKPKLIDEYIGRVNSDTQTLSLAHMRSPSGWTEPGQTPDFDEYTVVLKGMLLIEFQGGTLEVRAGQAVITRRGEWVRYSTPEPEGAEYIAVCSPAFTVDAAHRDSP